MAELSKPSPVKTSTLDVKLKEVVERAAGPEVKVKISLNPLKNAQILLPAFREALARVGDTTTKDDVLLAKLNAGPQRIDSKDGCFIVLPGVEAIEGATPEVKANAMQRLNHIALHEGSHCRQHFSKEAESKIRNNNDESMIKNEAAHHEMAAEYGAALFLLRDAYRSQNPTEISRVNKFLNFKQDENERAAKETSLKDRASLAKYAIPMARSIPAQQLIEMSDQKIREAVDTVGRTINTGTAVTSAKAVSTTK